MSRATKTAVPKPKKMILCISGMTGSGKSTIARELAEKYNLHYFSGGDALKALAIEYGFEPAERGWWESKEGMRFLEKRNQDQSFDRKIDSKLLEAAKRGNVVLDSWTVPWILEDGFKIWLEASPERRAERIAKRNKIGKNEALQALLSKEKQTKTIYKRLYGFNLGEDFKPFNFVLDTEDLDAKEVFAILTGVIENLVC